jgi:sec-independent protein translocase protein TatC
VVTKTDSHEATSGKMTIMSHLSELRSRLIKCVIVLLITTALAFVFAEHIFEFLKAPAGSIDLIFIEMVEMLSTYFKVSLAAGFIVAMPYFVYHLFAFVSPALTVRERGYIYRMLPAVMIMFLAGIAFAYYVACPPALKFLLTFGEGIAQPQIRIENYISIVTRLILAVGLVFETPIIIMFMSKMGLVTPEWLAARRKIWIVLSFVIAAIITPTFDPINQTIIAVPLIVLLELSIWLAKLVRKRRPESPPSA